MGTIVSLEQTPTMRHSDNYKPFSYCNRSTATVGVVKDLQSSTRKKRKRTLTFFNFGVIVSNDIPGVEP